MLTDTEAEHIPGCNMAFRRSALESIGGFDEQFRVAGDDVDICWRMLERGWKLGFSASALVWHHRRNSVRAYWRQQKGYGKAEALLEKKWPGKYNSIGHLTWLGRVYNSGQTRIFGTATRIYHGQWGSAPFQSLYQSNPKTILSLVAMPEWYLITLALALLGILGIVWRPLLFVLPILAVSVAIPIVNVCTSAARCRFQKPGPHFPLRVLTALLHMLQPAARLFGRLLHGLQFWRNRVPNGFVLPVQRQLAVWTERWRVPEERLAEIEAYLHSTGIPVQRGGDCDDWDLEIQGGFWGGARLLMAVEDHGAGTQYVRYRIWPKGSITGLVLTLMLSLPSAAAGLDGAWPICAALGALAFLSIYKTARDCGSASAVILHALQERDVETAKQQWAVTRAKG
jgi:hypothetical protein